MSLTTKAKIGVHFDDGMAPGRDVYLVSQCKAPSVPLFAIRPLPDGATLGTPNGFHKTPSPTIFSATVPLVQWKHQDRVVAEATFQNQRCLRFKGNTPTAFDSDVKADPKDYMGPYVFQRSAFQGTKLGAEVTLQTLPTYRFFVMKGKLTTVNGDSNERLINRRVHIEGEGEGDGSEWEMLFYEVDATDDETTSKEAIPREASKDFTTVMNNMKDEFERFAVGLCPWTKGKVSSAESLASYVMWTSMVRPAGRLTREVILMSKLWMNKVWSWDNCFNALGIAPLSLHTAVDQLQQLYDFQAADGRLPDSVDWQNVEWAFTKPPIQGWAMAKLLDRYADVHNSALLELYHSTAKFTDFWMQHRLGDKSALPYYSHGNDSGWDNSTAFDEQPVIVSPDCAAYLILQADLLRRLSAKLGLGDEHEERWKTLQGTITDALLSELWDGESFRIKNAITGQTRKSTSLIRLLPLVAAKHLPSEVVDKMSRELSSHLTDWGLATEEPASPHYESDGYWRGPIWAPPTLLIESGLRAVGRVELADRISERFRALCEKAGFAENYDAVRGEGLRDLSYTWSSSVFLVLRRETVERERL